MSEELREPTMGPKAPTGPELAAIVAAAEHLWPRATVEEEVSSTAENMWRFANRRWANSVAGRGRPRRPGTFS